jgi:DNA (cytosine-5)-methyltransferase 1
VPFIPGTVLGNLPHPIPPVGLLGEGPVLGAAVPETTVDENRHLGPDEDHVRPDWALLPDANRSIHSIPKTAPMQLRSQGELGARVPPLVGLHDFSALGRNGDAGSYACAAARDAILPSSMTTAHFVQDKLELKQDQRDRDKLDRRFLRTKKRPKPAVGIDFEVVDLFSGCGGMTIGAIEGARRAGKQAGLAMAVDNNPLPLEVLKHSLGVDDRYIAEADLTEVLAPVSGSSTSGEQSLFAGIVKGCLLLAGPPCQGHSALNNHTRHDDPRNDLYVAVGRVARILEPQAVIIENVRTVSSDRRASVKSCISILEEIGYHVGSQRLDLSTLGVPQRRVRHVVVATRERSFEWDLPAVAPRDLRWAIKDLLRLENSTRIDTPSKATEVNRDRMEWLIENDEYDLPDEKRPICHQSKHSYRSMYGRLRWDAPAQTITSGFGSMGQGRYVHPEKPRTLTPHEAARLQCLPDFVALDRVKNRGKLAEMIGNVAPPLLTSVLVERLIKQALL